MVNTWLVARFVMVTVGGTPGGLEYAVRLRIKGLSISPSSIESSLSITRAAACGPPLAELNVMVRFVELFVEIFVIVAGPTENTPLGITARLLITRLVVPELVRVIAT